MAITASATGGEWKATAAWEGAKVPGEADDVILGAGSGNITINSAVKCRSIDATSYKKTLTIALEAEQGILTIGTTTSNTGLCFKLGSEAKLVGTGESMIFKNSSGTVEKITTAGVAIPFFVTFEAGKFQFEDKFENSNTNQNIAV